MNLPRLFLTALGCLLLAAWPSLAAQSASIESLTKQLPEPDRIEIDLVHVKFETVDAVLGTKTLEGDMAKSFAKGWRSQNFVPDVEVECHAPAYRIRFFRQGGLITEATVCFHCRNIYFYRYAGAKDAKEYQQIVFGGSPGKEPDDAFKALHQYLARLFVSDIPALNDWD